MINRNKRENTLFATKTKQGYNVLQILEDDGDLIALIDRGNDANGSGDLGYILAWKYDESTGQWGQGHYFNNLNDAILRAEDRYGVHFMLPKGNSMRHKYNKSNRHSKMSKRNTIKYTGISSPIHVLYAVVRHLETLDSVGLQAVPLRGTSYINFVNDILENSTDVFTFPLNSYTDRIIEQIQSDVVDKVKSLTVAATTQAEVNMPYNKKSRMHKYNSIIRPEEEEFNDRNNHRTKKNALLSYDDEREVLLTLSGLIIDSLDEQHDKIKKYDGQYRYGSQEAGREIIKKMFTDSPYAGATGSKRQLAIDLEKELGNYISVPAGVDYIKLVNEFLPDAIERAAGDFDWLRLTNTKKNANYNDYLISLFEFVEDNKYDYNNPSDWADEFISYQFGSSITEDERANLYEWIDEVSREVLAYDASALDSRFNTKKNSSIGIIPSNDYLRYVQQVHSDLFDDFFAAAKNILRAVESNETQTAFITAVLEKAEKKYGNIPAPYRGTLETKLENMISDITSAISAHLITNISKTNTSSITQDAIDSVVDYITDTQAMSTGTLSTVPTGSQEFIQAVRDIIQSLIETKPEIFEDVFAMLEGLGLDEVAYNEAYQKTFNDITDGVINVLTRRTNKKTKNYDSLYDKDFVDDMLGYLIEFVAASGEGTPDNFDDVYTLVESLVTEADITESTKSSAGSIRYEITRRLADEWNITK